MYKFPIGVMLESFRKPFDEALKSAAEIGANGIQLYATTGEHCPENLDKNARRELLKKVKDHGMVFSALCGDFGKGFGDPEQNKIYIEKSKRVIDLAKDLDTNIVTTHIGVVPTDKDNPRYKIIQDACGELSDYAKANDAYFAVETGPETAVVLKEFLDTLSGAVRVNLDPANFKMVTGDDPVQAVYTLKDYIVHTHAKDGVKLMDADPEIVYHVVHPIPEEFSGKVFFKEVPLGEGSVPFEAYLKALEDINYKGFLTIEREVGENPAKDIKKAYDFLRELEEK
jgi:sugar phosphate isomerase/epimerase